MEKLNGKIRKAEKERCHVGKEEENVVHVLLKNIQNKRRTEKFLDNELLNVNGEPPYEKIISWNKIIEYKKGEFLHKVKLKWMKEVKKKVLYIYRGNEKGKIAVRNTSFYISMCVFRSD